MKQVFPIRMIHELWDDLVEASETIHEKTGKYGMMADENEQEGWANTIYQARWLLY